jgi:hypothetical protein
MRTHTIVCYDFLELLPHLVCHASSSTPFLSWLLCASQGKGTAQNHGLGDRPNKGEDQCRTPHACPNPTPQGGAPAVAKTIHGKVLAHIQSRCYWPCMATNCSPSPFPQKGIRGKTNKHVHTHRRRSGGPQRWAWVERVTYPRRRGEQWYLAQLQPMPSPASCPSVTGPAIRGNSYPKVTVPKKH